jgi:hypothetical protein
VAGRCNSRIYLCHCILIQYIKGMALPSNARLPMLSLIETVRNLSILYDTELSSRGGGTKYIDGFGRQEYQSCIRILPIHMPDLEAKCHNPLGSGSTPSRDALQKILQIMEVITTTKVRIFSTLWIPSLRQNFWTKWKVLVSTFIGRCVHKFCQKEPRSTRSHYCIL